MDLELVASTRAVIGEGPVWDDREHVLWWTDVTGKQLHRFDPASGVDSAFDVDREVGALVLSEDGGLLLATEDGFAPFVPGAAIEPLVPVDERSHIRMNDGKCDAAGRFYACTVAFSGEVGAGTLWRLDPDLSLHRLVDGLTVGNGLAWSLDGGTLYYIDSPTQSVDAFDVDPTTGSLAGRRTLVSIPPEQGSPDGMCIDDEGCLWVALWDGSALRRYSPTGEELAVVELPVSRVTCPAFGGPDGGDLYVTSAALGVSEEHAGGLFRLRPGVSGPAPYRFAGALG